MSKRVLMITRAYYPNNSSGTHRPAKFAKYLPRFGWTPVVLCADWTPENSDGYFDPSLAAIGDVCETIRVPYTLPPSGSLKRRVRILTEILWPFRAPLGFASALRRAAEDAVRRESFDAVWSTYRPGLTHWVASQVSRRHGIPWVADFRDLPDQTHKDWRAQRAVREEVAICTGARALVATSRPLADQLATRHTAPVHVILNGFDADDYPKVADERIETFTIGHFGFVYEFRDPRPLFGALDILARERQVDLDDVRVLFYATPIATVIPLAKPYACARIVQCLDNLPHREMAVVQQRTAVLLVLQSSEGGGSIPAKLYDYMATRRPVLNIPGDGGPIDELVRQTNIGFTSGDPAEIARILLAWYREWKATGSVRFAGEPQVLAYTREGQAAQLARILDSVLVGCSHSCGPQPDRMGRERGISCNSTSAGQVARNRKAPFSGGPGP